MSDPLATSYKLPATNAVFFGTSEEAVYALDALSLKEILPSLIVTAPDRPVGRHFTITPPPAKVWAQKNNIPVLQPEKLDNEFLSELRATNPQLLIVVGYGKILPQALIDMAKNQIINVHPSLLPLYRGPTPIEGPILAGDSETGVTIMIIDSEVDHGPIVRQEKYSLSGKEIAPELTKILFTRGGEMIAEILPDWIAEKILPEAQDHTRAIYTKKLKKEDGEIREEDDDEMRWRKYRAYQPWPGVFFFDKNGKRVKITAASFSEGKFIIEKVVPEGRNEIIYEKFPCSNV